MLFLDPPKGQRRQASVLLEEDMKTDLYRHWWAKKQLPITSATIGHADTELPHAEMEHAFLPDGGRVLKSYWLVGSSVLSVSGVPRSDQ